MARSRFPPLLLVLAVVTVAASTCLPSPGSAASDAGGGEYCRDSLSGLLACKDFMFGGAGAASPACCAAYSAAFDADPFCLCYIANGVFGRSTGYDVNVTHALEIPVSCGLVTPPIELCNMQGLVLPPYEPSSPQPPSAAKPADQSPQSPSAAKLAESPAATPAQSPMAAPSLPQAPKPSSPPPFTSPSPLPPPTSHGARGAAMGIGTVAAAVAVTTLLALLS